MIKSMISFVYVSLLMIGKHAKEKWTPCGLNPCENGATYQLMETTRNILVLDRVATRGTKRKVDIDECTTTMPHALQEWGTNGSYTCECKKGLEGRDCLLNTDDCLLNPCVKGGTCLDRVGDCTCLCMARFIGKNCQ